MSSSSRQRGILVLVIAALAIAGAAIFGWNMVKRHHALEFTVLFDNAKGLKAGQYLVYHGVRVGEVTGVTLADDGKVSVSVSVQPDHTNVVYNEAIFVIEKPGIIDVSGELQVTMKDGTGPRTPIKSGAMLAGTSGLFDELMKRGRGAVNAMLPSQTATSAPGH